METAVSFAKSGVGDGTWALVWATGLLALVTAGLVAIAALQYRQAAREREELSRRGANRIVPEISTLRARLNEAIRVARLRDGGDTSTPFRENWIADYSKFAQELDTYRDATLAFSNQVLALRHFLRLAEQAWPSRENKSGDGWTAVALNLTAARIALEAAEAEIPKAMRTVNGDEYWSRFKTSIAAHHSAAQHELLNDGADGQASEL